MFPRAVSPISVGYDQSRTLVASASFEYTRYVSGKINSIDRKRGRSNNKDYTNIWEKTKHVNFTEVYETLKDDDSWSKGFKTLDSDYSSAFSADKKNSFVAGELDLGVDYDLFK